MKCDECVACAGDWLKRNNEFKIRLKPALIEYLKEQYNIMGLDTNTSMFERQVNKNLNVLVEKIPDKTYAVSIDRIIKNTNEEIKNIVKSYNGIFIHPKFRDKDLLIKTLANDEIFKFHPEGCNSIKSIIDHEFGHALDNVFGLSKNNEIINAYTKFSVLIDEEQGNQLSRYAKKNIKEFVAEAYSEYKNNSKPREIAKLVGRILEEMSNEEK